MATVVNIMLIDDDPAEELIFRAQMKKVVNYDINMLYAASIEDAVAMFGKGASVDIVLLDNRLGPGEDFRESVPRLRQSGYIGISPIGVIFVSRLRPTPTSSHLPNTVRTSASTRRNSIRRPSAS